MIKCLIDNNPYELFKDEKTDQELRDLSKANKLICPSCGQPYTYCHGKIKEAYFRHYKSDICHDPEPETEEHIVGKTKLYKWLQKFKDIKNVVLENSYPEYDLRPDITFQYNNEEYALEYQCSPISSEYEERHEKYKKAGIKDIWICGTEKYFGLNKRQNHLEGIARMYFNPFENKFYFLPHMTEHKFENLWTDAQGGCEYWYKNYETIKDWHISFHRYTYWPSPTGRPSNKYPYKATGYNFIQNNSIALVQTMKQTSVFKILKIGGEQQCQE